jgi:hypothetical protein
MFGWDAAAGRVPLGIAFTVIAASAALEAIAAALDLVMTTEVEGEVIRLRARLPDFDRGLLTIIVHRPRWFLVIDDGRERLNALSIHETKFRELCEGDRVRVTVTRLFRRVKAITLVQETKTSGASSRINVRTGRRREVT